MAIRYFVEPNPVKPERLRAVLLRSRKKPVGDFLSYCESISTVHRADAQAVLAAMVDWIKLNADEGREVDFGALGQTRLGMTASIDVETRALKPADYRLTISMEASRQLKKEIASIGHDSGVIREAKPFPGPTVGSVRDMMTNQENVYTPDGLLELRGRRLKFDERRSDEGLFFKPVAGGSEIRAAVYQAVRDRTVRAVVPKKLADDVQLVVRARRTANAPKPLETTCTSNLHPAAPG